MDGLHCTDVYETHSSQQYCIMFLSTKFGHSDEEIFGITERNLFTLSDFYETNSSTTIL
jgi:hypothetical protein